MLARRANKSHGARAHTATKVLGTFPPASELGGVPLAWRVGMVRSPDEYRQKALAADLMALRVTDPKVRAAYQDIARGWRDLADNLDLAGRGRKTDPTAEGPTA